MIDLVADGMVPDVDTLLQRIPEDHPHQRLYISANVSYLDEEGTLDEDVQGNLRDITGRLIQQAGRGMNIDATVLDDWISSICEEQISNQRTSIYNVAALCLNNLEDRQQLLACNSIGEAMHELNTHVQDLFDEAE